MIDTHTHLYFSDFGNDIPAILNKAKENGVLHFILPNVDSSSINQLLEFKSLYPDITSIAIGLHPTEVKQDWEEIILIMQEYLEKHNFVAIGEIGMDLYWDQSFLEEQKKAFEKQLMIAEKKKLPVIIHCRSALNETLEIIKKIQPTVPLIFHSFTGNREDVKKIREICDPYFGINGVVTYKNAQDLRDALSEIGIDRIVLETDSPYLTPVPHRGKRNDSSYLIHILDKVSEVLSVPKEKIETITDQNAVKIFKI